MTLVQEDQALQLIKEAKNILLAPSSPDGDSIGSSLALMRVLKALGKEVIVVATDDVPDYLQFLPYTSEIKTELTTSKDFVISLSTKGADVDHLKYEVENGKINIIITPKSGHFTGHDISFPQPSANFDLIITVDTGDLVQLGKLYENNKGLFEHGKVLNIDHHASNGKFGMYNFLDFSMASTTQMITPLIQRLEKESGKELIDEDVATLLLVGIITDTGSFQHSNTSPEAFEVAADLLERGARQQEIIKHIFKTKSLATLKLWGRVLSKLQYEEEKRLVYATITQQDLADTGAESEDSGGIIDELMSNAPNAEVVMLLKEKEPGFVSGSLRAPGNLADVSEIAGLMGGGGHKKAAGFRIRNKSMAEALDYATNTIGNYMSAKLGVANLVEEPEPIPQNEPQPEPQFEAQQTTSKLFPNLAVHPAGSKPQNSVPKPSPGGEDMLFEDFKKRQEDSRVAAFFQDADGQKQPEAAEQEKTVGDVLQEMRQMP